MQLTIDLVFEKAAGYMLEPSKYPLPQDSQCAERAIYNLMAAMPKRRQKKFTQKHDARLGMTAAQRKNYYGDLATVNIKLPKSIADQVKGIAAPPEVKLNKAEEKKMQDIIRAGAVKPSKKGTKKAVPKAPAQALVAARVNFSASSLTCEKTSEIRKDEINLAAFATDSAGVQQDRAPFFVGDFKKGDTVNLGANALLFSLDVIDDSVGGFPATFTAGLFLVEEDWIHNRELSNKLSIACYAIYGVCMAAMAAIITVGMLGGPVTVAMAYLAIAVGMTFLIIGIQLLPLITDDVSGVATDTLVLEALPAIGDRFDRTLAFDLQNWQGDITTGKYTAAVSWEVVAV